MSTLDDLFERALARPDVYLPAIRAEVDDNLATIANMQINWNNSIVTVKAENERLKQALIREQIEVDEISRGTKQANQILRYENERLRAEVERLKEVLTELRHALSPTYRMSPEGRKYLEKIEAALTGREAG